SFLPARNKGHQSGSYDRPQVRIETLQNEKAPSALRPTRFLGPPPKKWPAGSLQSRKKEEDPRRGGRALAARGSAPYTLLNSRASPARAIEPPQSGHSTTAEGMRRALQAGLCLYWCESLNPRSAQRTPVDSIAVNR